MRPSVAEHICPTLAICLNTKPGPVAYQQSCASVTVTPPISGSLTPQFHRSFSNAVVTHTNYFYQEPVKVKGMSYPSKAKDTHRLLVGDAFSHDQPPATCPFSKLSSTFKNLWS